MRGLFLLSTWLLALMGRGAAQSSADQFALLGALPPCATTCLLSASQKSPCSMTDFDCQCANQEFVKTAETCVMMSCTLVESLSAKNTTQTMCRAPVRNKTATYEVASTILMALACVTVLVRLGYKKFFTTIDLGLDDWFILLALLTCVPSAVLNVTMLAKSGLGKDIWTLTPAEITEFAKAFWIITLLYFSEVFILKLSLLFFYLRIFPNQGIRRLLYMTIAFDVMFGLSFVFAAAFQCIPVSDNWEGWRKPGGGQCLDQSKIAWANAAVSITLDVWMLLLPMSRLRDLKLHWKKKVGVGLMFCVGTFVTVVSIVRLSSLLQFRGSANLTWDYFDVSLWSTVEITIGIICACMPSLRMILVRVWPKIFDGTLVRRATYYYPRGGQGGNNSKSLESSGRGTTTDKSKSKGSRASRGSWMLRGKHRSLAAPAHPADEKIFVDGVQFSKVSYDDVELNDVSRLVGPSSPNWQVAVTISGGDHGSRADADSPTSFQTITSRDGFAGMQQRDIAPIRQTRQR